MTRINKSVFRDKIVKMVTAPCLGDKSVETKNKGVEKSTPLSED
jgi:hypothetical protein